MATVPFPSPKRHLLERLSSEQSLFAVVVLGLLLQAALVPVLPVNWDEFRFLADVHELARGELSAPVQTFHAHLFLWLTWLPLDEIGQVIAGRMTMWVLECGTAALIYRCAREFGDRPSALFALACYLTLSFVMRHGASFRFDPPSTFLMMAATTLLLTGPMRAAPVALAGAMVALSAMITIKSVFFVPTIAGIAWYRWQNSEDRRRSFWILLSGAGAGACALAALYLYHWLNLSPDPSAAQSIVAGSVDKTIGQSRFLPRADALVASVVQSPVNWIVILMGIGASAAAVRRSSPEHRPKALALLSFAIPLATLAFYRNAFPYYFTSMLAPVSVVCLSAVPSIARRLQPSLLVGAMLLIAAANAAAQPFEILGDQRTVIRAAHAIFPKGADYIDRCSMMSSARKHGIFMSSWGLEVYRDAGVPIFRGILVKEKPAFLIANSPALQTALVSDGIDERLLPADAAVLRENFVRHWGPIWVAGKTLKAGDSAVQFEILVPGEYTVEGSGAFQLDGSQRQPGDVVTLTAGNHVASNVPASTTLRWGRQLKRPANPAPSSGLFADL